MISLRVELFLGLIENIMDYITIIIDFIASIIELALPVGIVLFIIWLFLNFDKPADNGFLKH